MVGLTCEFCGTVVRRSTESCDECGTPIPVPEDIAEIKQVTVLFADVVRSMDIAVALDFERLRHIITELAECSTEVVNRFGGSAVEFTGGGVMAVFGAPIAAEDHGIQACLAALEIQEQAKRLAVEFARRYGVVPRLGVGLHSGRALVGEMGPGALGCTAIGEPVGFAQRMESVSPGGGVMLSETTARLAERDAVLGEPQHARFKGCDAPVVVRRLLGVNPGYGAAGLI